MTDSPQPPVTDPPSSGRSRNPNGNSSSRSSDRSNATYGYHNTFHTHAQLPIASDPPSYECANSDKTLDRLNAQARTEAAARSAPLPSYSCSVHMEGILGLKQELVSPFQIAANREWGDVYAILQGTQFSIYRVKTPHLFSKSRSSGPGRLLKSFTLQHAEVGIALDFKKTPLIPKSPFAHLTPSSARQKLYESEPSLFEPVREHVMRLRLETQQFLLCAQTQEELLDWVEAFCAAVDISPPIEDRSEPRYRSLPRRSRRQRMLDGSRVASNLNNLNNLQSGRRLIAEQERILREFYPHLANSASEGGEHTRGSHVSDHPMSGDPEADDLDPADARFPPTHRPNSSGVSHPSDSDGHSGRHATDSDSNSNNNQPMASSDPKMRPPIRHSASQALRYRRRCAPVLLASSPRVSDVVFSEGKRMRINVKEHILVDYSLHPPRYDVHSFPKDVRPLPAVAEESAGPGDVTAKTNPPQRSLERPASPTRGISDTSIATSLNSLDSYGFGYDLGSTSSAEPYSRLRLDATDSDEITSVNVNSEPPSPTTAMPPKGSQHITKLAKPRSSEEQSGDMALNSVVLGVSLLI